MTGEHVSLLINAGIAGVFAVFALLLFDRFIKFIESQNARWQEFLERESQDTYAALKEIASKLEALTALLIRHDKQAEDFIRGEETRPRGK